jgi:hypothetical protein
MRVICGCGHNVTMDDVCDKNKERRIREEAFKSTCAECYYSDKGLPIPISIQGKKVVMVLETECEHLDG